MRAVLLILILVVVLAIAAFATGLVDIDQTRGAKAPDIDASRSGVTASGGQAPAFDVETGSVQVGTAQTNVTVPTLEIQQVGNDSGQAPANVSTQ